MKNLTLCEQSSIFGGNTTELLICTTSLLAIGYYIRWSFNNASEEKKQRALRKRLLR